MRAHHIIIAQTTCSKINQTTHGGCSSEFTQMAMHSKGNDIQSDGHHITRSVHAGLRTVHTPQYHLLLRGSRELKDFSFFWACVSDFKPFCCLVGLKQSTLFDGAERGLFGDTAFNDDLDFFEGIRAEERRASTASRCCFLLEIKSFGLSIPLEDCPVSSVLLPWDLQ